jgi:hypothetical protein
MMELLTYLAVLVLILISFLLGYILSKICFEESKELLSKISYVNVAFMFLLSVLSAMYLKEQNALISIPIILCGLILMIFTNNAKVKLDTFQILENIFIGIILFFSSLIKQPYIAICIISGIFIYGLLQSTIISWNFCLSRNINEPKKIKYKHRSELWFLIVSRCTAMLATALLLFVIF